MWNCASCATSSRSARPAAWAAPRSIWAWRRRRSASRSSRLEGELATRLLQRQSTGVVPTDAGLAFLQQALTLRRRRRRARGADGAVVGARQHRPRVDHRIGAGRAADAGDGRARYPAVRVHLVEALSGHLTTMLNARQLDLAILFRADAGRRWSVTPLLDEKLYVIGAPDLPGMPAGARVRLEGVARDLPLILPSPGHGLRALTDAAFARQRITPRACRGRRPPTLLMDAVPRGSRCHHSARCRDGASARWRGAQRAAGRCADGPPQPAGPACRTMNSRRGPCGARGAGRRGTYAGA